MPLVLVISVSAATDEDLRYHMAKNYHRLTGLPWIQEYRMPDWLRFAILMSLPESILDEIRGVTRDLTDEGVFSDDVIFREFMVSSDMNYRRRVLLTSQYPEWLVVSLTGLERSLIWLRRMIQS